MTEGAGPFSMLAVSALEDRVRTVEFAGKKFAAVQVPVANGNLTPLMIFCRGVLGYDDQQRLILRDMMGGGVEVKPGDWIVMVSRTEYTVHRMSDSESLFSLMPDTPLSTPEARLSRIAQAHSKNQLDGGGTTGDCDECGFHWPCPTYVWATKPRDVTATWNPADDEEQESPPRRGEVQRARQIMNHWDRSKEQEEWAQMILSRAERLGERE